MYERVMVPLDGSSFGEYAIPYALQIASRTGAAVDLVHVHVRDPEEGLSAITPYQFQHVTRHYEEWDRDELRHELEELREKASALAAETGLPVTAQVLSGQVVSALRDEAERFHADIIVMATHARTGLNRVRLGSVADVIVRRATMPVLLVQPTQGAMPAPTYRRILVPLDGSPFSEDVLEPADQFARLHDAEIRLIHVVEQRGWLGAANLGRLAGRPGTPVEMIWAPRAADGIIDVAEEWGADLIAIATHGRGGLTRVIVGSTASDLLERTTVPVMLHRPVPAATNPTDMIAQTQPFHA